MPITLGAIRKQRADKRKAVVNTRVRNNVREAVAKMRKKPSKSGLEIAFRNLDRAAKAGVVHENKAARLKSRLAKLLIKK
jgi:small subunit ribosomal protein S20